MPFAPVTLYEKANDCYIIPKGKDPYYTAKFMTITFDCTEEMKIQSPAVVHIDGTARPQLIKKEDHPFYYDILNEYHKLTGVSSLVNTSFNMHEEPIVCTPEEAIISFKQSGLDYICMGSYLISKSAD
jgi:carbamoyltransferase